MDAREGGGGGGGGMNYMENRMSSLHQPSPSPWHRMKWTDSMIRLLIMIVYCVGDDASATTPADHPKGKRTTASSSSSSALLLQTKKGKWKSVSRAMMEKGFYVSPQQCEDKFNDLNKRYKRVHELLGDIPTACRVLDNQSLLDSLPHVSPKAKEEARKLLNSKHLFFREMCAYHRQQQPALLPQQQQEAVQLYQKDHVNIVQDQKHHGHDHDDDEEEEEEDYDDDDDIKDDGNDKEEEEEEEESPPLSLSLMSSSSPSVPNMEQLRNDVMMHAASTSRHVLQRGETEILYDDRQWMKRKAIELEEQHVEYQCRALKLEKQRFKWVRYSSNKEREMKKMKLDNERLLLENERMLLLLRQKEQQQ